jgi:Fe-S oxidoreductase
MSRIEEFLASEIEAGNITASSFTDSKERIRMHGHCFQKALSSLVPLKKILSLPKNYSVLNIPSGCCGMAGSFGYEKEHYEISMNIGELVLFPAIRAEETTTLISASGTSCRHQIADGTGREALHPVEILYRALK